MYQSNFLHCITNETHEFNTIHEKYWIKYTKTKLQSENLKSGKQFNINSKSWEQIANDFSTKRQLVMQFGALLQFKLANRIESFQRAAFVFDCFYQSLLKNQKIQEIVQFIQLEFMYLTIAAALLLSTKYEEIYPAPIEDFIHVLGLLKTKNYPDGINVDRETFMEVERKILIENSWNFSRPIGINYLRILTVTLSSNVDPKINNEIHELSKFLLETSIVNSKTCHIAPSTAAVFSAMAAKKIISVKNNSKIFSNDKNVLGEWGGIEEQITGYKENDASVQQCLTEIMSFSSQVIQSAPKHNSKPDLDNFDFTNKYNPSMWGIFKGTNYVDKVVQKMSVSSFRKPKWKN